MESQLQPRLNRIPKETDVIDVTGVKVGVVARVANDRIFVEDGWTKFKGKTYVVMVNEIQSYSEATGVVQLNVRKSALT